MSKWADYIEQIREWCAEGFTDRQIATKLTQMTGEEVSKQTVAGLRYKHGIKTTRGRGRHTGYRKPQPSCTPVYIDGVLVKQFPPMWAAGVKMDTVVRPRRR